MSEFSRRNYIRVAGIISQCSSIYGDKQHLFNEFCKMFKEDNPQFNKEKFAEACECKKEVE